MSCRLLLSVLLFASLGCSQSMPSAAGRAATDRDAEATAVYEAVLRHQVQRWRVAQRPDAVCYVWIDGKDPSPAFLEQLGGDRPALAAGSQAPKGKGLHLHVEELKWLDDDTAELKGGFSDGKDGSQNRYRVVRRDGHWVVDKDVVEAMS